MCMTNRNKCLPSSLDYINKTSEYSVARKQYKHIFNGSSHITVMNAFPNKNIVGSYSMSRHVLHWKFVIVLPEYAMNTAVFNQLIMQLLFCKLSIR